MSSLKRIRVWLSPPGPNPWKVITILEELQVPYQVESIRYEDIKKPSFVSINPNGRVPAIEDPNTGLTLWETGAIIQYLVKQYDADNRIHYNDLKQGNLCSQWLMFQVSGQGPYFGQCTWFTFLHAEKLPSAIDRYANEIKRVLGVMETVLTGKPDTEQWLVGNRITYTDLVFVPWNDRLDATLRVPEDKKFEGFPHVQAWHQRMTSRPSWVKAMELRARLMDEQGLDWNGMPKSNKSFQEFQENSMNG
ncbi:hypothetical protein S40293_08925 [Stachybotrys chartarum IBT 40293]|nr:hypothetical protein S40293_08925 [Stachybotrys chartarum IBT 40293]